MKEPEKHLSALCRLYLEVALIDPEHGVCRLLSTDTSGTFLRNTEAFDAVTIGELAGQHVAPEDRQRFSDISSRCGKTERLVNCGFRVSQGGNIGQ